MAETAVQAKEGLNVCWKGRESEGRELLAEELRGQGLCASADEDRVLVLRLTAEEVAALPDTPENTAGLEAEEHHVIAYTDNCCTTNCWTGSPYRGVLLWEPAR